MTYSLNRRELLVTGAGLTAALAAPAVLAQGSNKLNILVTTSPPDPNAHYFWWAAENGFYRDANLDVTIKSIVADTTTVRGLIAGEGDIGWAGSGSGMLAMAAGSRLKILSSFDPRLDFSIVASKDLPDLKALVGRPFAISQIGATSHVVSQLMVERAVGGRADVQWLSVGSGSARLQALNAKRVDATILNSLQAVAALKNANLHKLGDGLSQLPQFIYSWEIVTEAALKAKPDQLKAFIAATSRGVAWGMANPADAAKISQKLLPDIAPDDLLEVIKTYSVDKYFDTAGALRRADWDYTVAALMKAGGLGKSLKFDEFVESGITAL